MWITENRPRYNRRDKLRYPSDLSDEECVGFYLVRSFRPAEPGGGKRSVVMRNVVDGVMYILEHGLSVASDPKKTFRRAARCSTTSISGAGTAPWSAFTMRST